MLAHVYAKSVVQSSSQLEENSVVILRNRFLPLLEEAARKGTAVDVYDVNNGLTMDFMTAYLFGINSSTNYLLDVKGRQRFLESYHCRRPYEVYSQELADLKVLASKLGVPLIPKFVDDANDEIEAWLLTMCDSADMQIESASSPGAEPVVYKQLKKALAKDQSKDHQSSTQAPLRLQVASEMLDHLGAGHETSAVALTYLFWEMSRHTQLQDRLRQELLAIDQPIRWPVPSDQEEFKLPSAKTLDALPLLHVVVMETLRLHAPIPGIQPRVTPGDGCTLAGYCMPGNVRVSAMAHALHRNEEVFPDPEEWKVDRWLKPADSPELKEMLRWFWAFGSGGRMCIGSNLAMLEIKLAVAAVYSNYTTAIMDDTDIEETDAYTIRPRSNQLILRFTAV